jgi:hypothetical protein
MIMNASSLEENISSMPPAPPSPSAYVQHCNEEYGIPYLVDFGLLHESNATVDIVDYHTPPVNMTYDEELIQRVAKSAHQEYQDDGLPVARLRHPQGSSVDICLHGGAITSWKRPDGSEMLQLDSSNKYDGKNPILGGLTVAWPQLGAGALPLVNGVLQYLHWSVMETSCWDIEEDPQPSITLYADSEDVALSSVREEFTHPFEAMLTVTLGLVNEDEGDRMNDNNSTNDDDTSEDATNQDEEEADEKKEEKKGSDDLVPQTGPAFGLTYQLSIMNKHETDILNFSTGAIANMKVDQGQPNTVKVNGLVGKYVLDYSEDPMRPALEIENEHFIKPLILSKHASGTGSSPRPASTVSRLYVDCPKEGEVLFCPGSQHHFDVRNQHGFSDILLEAKEKSTKSVTVAAARKAKPVRLQPGEVWHGEVTFKAFDRYWPISAFEMEHDQTNIPVPAREQALLKVRRSEEASGESNR